MLCDCTKGGGPLCDECATQQIEALSFQGEELDPGLFPPGAAAGLMAQLDGWFAAFPQQGQEEAGR